MDQLLVTVEEACNALRIGRTKCYELIARGALHPIKIDRSVRFSVDELRRFVETKTSDDHDRP